jgi:RND family efflux transporter MFP subunit
MHAEKKTSAAEGGGTATGEQGGAGQLTRVTVTRPRPHGIVHATTQPGSIHAFEQADLFAKVSGYLKSQTVDFGSHVKEGQVLAVIEDPEIEKAVEQNVAAVKQAKAAEKQAEARIKTAEAGHEAAKATVKQAEVDVEKFTASLKYRQKERNRIEDLVRRNAIEPKLADEQLDRYDSTVAAVHSAEAAVLTAKAQRSASEAKVEQAKADLAEAQANVAVAQANLDKAKVLAGYMTIRSPYNGVVTRRTFYRGDFIKSAEAGNEKPLFSISRTDKVKVFVPVPDRDVPFVNVGDPATVRVDALPDKTFKGEVSRYADSENPADRTMHTEIDLPNDDNLLRDGMYGGVTITLEPASKNLTVPSSCLIEQLGEGKGAVYVVRDGKAHRTDVRVGKDNGVDVEIIEGLKADDEVVMRYNGALADDMPVEAESAKVASNEPQPATH